MSFRPALFRCHDELMGEYILFEVLLSQRAGEYILFEVLLSQRAITSSALQQQKIE
jgi:hypothetical protein